ncbi:hypothetical protein KUL42_36410 [Alteromonas sp. KUL42]|uniref:outer membrane protein assembly factor BamB family protein n=1 Tax=Alteromonas sp. KUL42 TaxID=2480797 RepID=UPI0010FFBE4A|nr:PQQ-binding-like beta-propeller repeat protein [Alteromonas sp. KUL42]GEA08880.1 hypothetical protein KUL42_36410 [Alteromonas sp. KUL42]
MTVFSTLSLATNTNLESESLVSTGSEKWRSYVGTVGYGLSPALSDDENIYVVSIGGGVSAFDFDGQLLWTNSEQRAGGTPVIGSDGTIYYGSFGFYLGLVALNPDGTLKWHADYVGSVSSPAIGADGVLYVIESGGGSKNRLVAINPTGTLKWKAEITPRSPSNVTPVIFNDSIYVPTYNGLYAFNSTGALLWVFGESELFGATPSIALDGTIYIGANSGVFYALNPNGVVKWSFDVEDYLCTEGCEYFRYALSSAVVSNDGTIYFGSRKTYITSETIGSHLHAMSKEGKHLWAAAVEGAIDPRTSPSITISGVLYVTSSDGNLYAFDVDGSIKWVYPVYGFRFWDQELATSPAIGKDGTVYITAYGHLHAINSSYGRLSNAPWPKMQSNNQNIGRNVIQRNYSQDFDGDGVSDLVFRRPLNGYHYVRQSSSQGISYTFFGNLPSDIPINGDFDGDAISDIAVYRAATGQWLIKQSSDNRILRITFGTQSGDIPVPADYDGDGITDIAIRRPIEGKWIIRLSSNPNTNLSLSFGSYSSDIPIPADYDGDGKVDIAIRRPSTNQFIIRESSSNKIKRIFFGSQYDDVAVPADYDGDGRADIAVRRPNTGYWFIKYSSNGQIYRAYFGTLTSDIPVPADYDGDGKADLAVRRSDSGHFIYAESANNRVIRVGFGSLSSDIPLAAPIQTRIEMSKAVSGTKEVDHIQSIDSDEVHVSVEQIGYLTLEQVHTGAK